MYVKLYLIDWYYLNDNLIGFLIFNDFFIVKLVFCKNQITENKRVSIYNINLTFFQKVIFKEHFKDQIFYHKKSFIKLFIARKNY